MSAVTNMITGNQQSDEDNLKMILDTILLGMRTGMPGIVDSAPFKKGKFWCVDVIPAIRQVDGTVTPVVTKELAKLSGVPIVSLSAKGYAITMPISQGDEVFLSVSDRGIDNHQIEGGVQNPPEINSVRHHDLTDAVAIVGELSVSCLDEYYSDGISVQNKAGSTYLRVNDESVGAAASGGGSFSLEGGVFTINADINHTGNQTTSGTVSAPTMTASTSLTVAGTEMDSHVHGGVSRGTENTDPV